MLTKPGIATQCAAWQSCAARAGWLNRAVAAVLQVAELQSQLREALSSAASMPTPQEVRATEEAPNL